MNLTTSVQGWTPEAYLEEQVAPSPRPVPPPPPPAPKTAPVAATNGISTIAAAKAKPTPPAPPAKRPVAGRKTIPARDSAVSMNSQDSSGGSGRATPSSVSNASLAGGLAEALRQRQSALRGSQEDDDDW
jgi:myosin I